LLLGVLFLSLFTLRQGAFPAGSELQRSFYPMLLILHYFFTKKTVEINPKQ